MQLNRVKVAIVALTALSPLTIAVSFSAANETSSTQGSGQCVIATGDELWPEAPIAEDGLHRYEHWLANDSAQKANVVVEAAISDYLKKQSDIEESSTELERGLVGVTPDFKDEVLVAVVDPTRISSVELTAAILTALEVSGLSGALNVEVREGCHSAADLLRTKEELKAALKPAMEAGGSYSLRLDRNDSTVHLVPPGAQLFDVSTVDDMPTVTVDDETVSPRTRQQDGEPHKGGAEVFADIGTNRHFCTSWTAVYAPGLDKRTSASAGHCWGNNESVYSGSHYYGLSGFKQNLQGVDSPCVLMDRIRATSQ